MPRPDALMLSCGVIVVAVAIGVAKAADAGAVVKADPCQDAQTQMEMNACAKADAADAELNRVYTEIVARHRADARFLEKLKAAQRAWIAFRDAELGALYPAANPRDEYGSVYPMCWASALETLTRARTAELRQWIDGVPEGDVCAGSLPRK